MSTLRQKDIALLNKYHTKGLPRAETLTVAEHALVEEFRARLPDGWVMEAEAAPVHYQEGRAVAPPPYISVLISKQEEVVIDDNPVPALRSRALPRRRATVRADRAAMEENFREFLLQFGLTERA